MKTGLKIILLTVALTALAARAQTNYTIDWYTIDGGGGTSTGGTYSVSGTIGQPDAGTMSGGNYTLQGGFWSVIAAVQMPGAPRLTITITGPSTVTISWPYPSLGFGLQQNGNLTTTNWTSVGTTPVQDGDNWKVTVTPTVGNKFYRLAK
jgi:hypothetical protein